MFGFGFGMVFDLVNKIELKWVLSINQSCRPVVLACFGFD
jgi:hypothetical protein